MIRKPHSIPSALALACAVSLLAACGGGGGGKGTPTVTYTVSGTISGLKGSAVLANAGDTVTVTGDGSFSFPTPVPEGSTYDAQVQSLQFANQTCLVANGTGTANADVDDIVVTCLPHNVPKYAYVANYNGATLSQYAIGADGALSPVAGGSVATESEPNSVAVHPNGRFVYVTNSASNSISQFAIGADGALSPLSPASVTTNNGPSFITVAPSGKAAYVSNFHDNTVTQY